MNIKEVKRPREDISPKKEQVEKPPEKFEKPEKLLNSKKDLKQAEKPETDVKAELSKILAENRAANAGKEIQGQEQIGFSGKVTKQEIKKEYESLKQKAAHYRKKAREYEQKAISLEQRIRSGKESGKTLNDVKRLRNEAREQEKLADRYDREAANFKKQFSQISMRGGLKPGEDKMLPPELAGEKDVNSIRIPFKGGYYTSHSYMDGTERIRSAWESADKQAARLKKQLDEEKRKSKKDTKAIKSLTEQYTTAKKKADDLAAKFHDRARKTTNEAKYTFQPPR